MCGLDCVFLNSLSSAEWLSSFGARCATPCLLSGFAWASLVLSLALLIFKPGQRSLLMLVFSFSRELTPLTSSMRSSRSVGTLRVTRGYLFLLMRSFILARSMKSVTSLPPPSGQTRWNSAFAACRAESSNLNWLSLDYLDHTVRLSSVGPAAVELTKGLHQFSQLNDRVWHL